MGYAYPLNTASVICLSNLNSKHSPDYSERELGATWLEEWILWNRVWFSDVLPVKPKLLKIVTFPFAERECQFSPKDPFLVTAHNRIKLFALLFCFTFFAFCLHLKTLLLNGIDKAYWWNGLYLITVPNRRKHFEVPTGNYWFGPHECSYCN